MTAIPAIADGETIIRHWNPELIHGTLSAARKRLSKSFPCVHRITPSDPTTHLPTTRRRYWAVAPPKIDFARYAKDYACAEPPKNA